MKAVKTKIDDENLKAVKKARSMVLWIIEILAAILLALLFAIAFCFGMTAQDVSMDPTILSGDKILVNRAAYLLGKPDRGDLLVYTEGEGNSATIHIKRVMGLPGDTIRIREGQLIINDKTYTTDTEYPDMLNAGLAKESLTVGTDEYFVLGDNRNESADSRFADVGNIKKSQIIGKAWFRTGPDKRRGFVK